MPLTRNISRGYRYCKNFGLSAYLEKKRCHHDKSRYLPLIKRTLERDMAREIADISSRCDFSLAVPVKQEDFRIFVLWWQGVERMPRIVSDCIASIRRAAGGDVQVCLLTKDNYRSFVSIDPVIEAYREQGIISLTHFSDILRFNLLEKYGGLWMDATLFVAEPFARHPEVCSSSLFSIRSGDQLDNRKYVPQGRWASFCLGTNVCHHPLFRFAKEYADAYWKKHSMLIDYFLVDYIFDIAYDHVPCIRKEIDSIPPNNVDYLYLQKHIAAPWNREAEKNWGGCAAAFLAVQDVLEEGF